MLDLEKELKCMSEAYNIPEKEVVSWWRTAVRQMFSSSVFYRKYVEDSSKLIVNENPRSMKRFPMVKRFTCAICGEEVGSGDIEVDHLDGGNTNKSFSDAESFIKSIMFATPKDIQVLCKDKHKVVNKKKTLVKFGCHGIKTLADKHNCSFEEAKVRKKHILIGKDKRFKEELEARGMVVPKTIKEQSTVLLDTMLSEIESKGESNE